MAESGASFRRLQVAAFDRLHSFHGGLRLPGHRDVTAATPIAPAGIPPELVLPLQQHIGEPAECLVSPGDYVYKGQGIAKAPGAISAAVHASSSGTVAAVEKRPVPHPSGLQANCIVIETDGKDRYRQADHDAGDYRQMEPAKLCDIIRQAGIVGLGGAGFPTQVKLCTREQHVELLLINAVECEPYISCDNRLLQERAAEVIEGIKILRHAVQPDTCIIAIEDNMPAASPKTTATQMFNPAW